MVVNIKPNGLDTIKEELDDTFNEMFNNPQYYKKKI